ncbi:MAG: YdcF family protein [Syntrophomonas sp.]
MLYVIKNFYTVFLLPPGIFIVLLLLLAFYLRKKDRNSTRLILALAFLLYIFSTPFVGDLLLFPLESRYSPPEKLQGDVLVMLGGGATGNVPDVNGTGTMNGSSSNRLLTAARLTRTSQLPIIISTGQVYSDDGSEAIIAERILLELQIPRDKIILDNNSLNTMASASNIPALLAQYQFKNPILVTSAFHMHRSVRSFAKYGVTVQPYPCDYMVNARQAFYLNKLLPSYGGLYKTGVALREYWGLIPTIY